jgi:hypothetical protein
VNNYRRLGGLCVTFVGFHVRSQIADGTVRAGAPVILAVVTVNGRFLGVGVCACYGQGGMRWFFRHFIGVSRVDLHVNLVQRNRVVDVTKITHSVKHRQLLLRKLPSFMAVTAYNFIEN